MTPLPRAFVTRPIAHRAYHAEGRPENSRAAIRAAIEAGYGIEIDVQLSADGQAMVFHDYELDRLTGDSGPVRERSAEELSQITLTGNGEGIPTLSEVLDLVAGQVPLLIEVKDQDGAFGPDVGPLEEATAAALETYNGPVAVMSFNPHSVAEMARRAPQVPRGLTTCPYRAEDFPTVPAARFTELASLADAEPLAAGFISHQVDDLDNPRVAELKAAGLAILCWTVRSPEVEAEARRVADNVTFEGYPA